MLKEQSQSLDNIEIRLSGMMQNIMVNAKQSFQLTTVQIFQSSALQKFEKLQDLLKTELKSLNLQIKNIIDRKKLLLESISSNLKAVNPLAILDRGYAIVMNEEGRALKSSKDVKVGDTINTRLADGGFSSDVSKKN